MHPSRDGLEPWLLAYRSRVEMNQPRKFFLFDVDYVMWQICGCEPRISSPTMLNTIAKEYSFVKAAQCHIFMPKPENRTAPTFCFLVKSNIQFLDYWAKFISILGKW